MAKVFHRKTILSAILLSLLIFSTIAYLTPLAQAEAGGTGKFLEIKFTTINPDDEADLLDSNCNVTATKVSADQTFTYIASDSETHSQKVGAGTVLLDAIPDTSNGWIFSHFVIRGEEKPDLSYYKTEKYDVVQAVFDRLSYTVFASVASGAGAIFADGVDITAAGEVSVYHGESVAFSFTPDEGYYLSNVISSAPMSYPYVLGPIISDGEWIEVYFELYTYDIAVYVVGGRGQIELDGTIVADESNNVDNPAHVAVDWGSSPKFEFIPYIGTENSYHLSSVLVDGTTYVDLVTTEFTQSYQFIEIKEDGHTLAVTFSVDGQADIAGGSNVTVFLSSFASLTFGDVGDGYAFGNELLSISPGDVVVWEITVDATLGQQVIVALRYDDTGLSQTEEENLRMYRSDVDYDLWLHCDFNDDGTIDGQDVKVISNIVKHPKFLPDEYEDPELYQWYLDNYDLDGSGTIDELDIHVVNTMKNIEWIDITYGPVDTVNNIIYGLTDHFSIFRGR